MRGPSLLSASIACVSLLTLSSLASAVDVEVLFQVDMNSAIANTVFDPGSDSLTVRGSFNAWDGCTEMADVDADGIYELEVQLPGVDAGTVLAFKYVICPDTWEDSITDRIITVEGTEPDGDGDGFVEITFGGVWDQVGQIGDPTLDAEVTFRVDMNVQMELGDFDPLGDFVVVRGALNGWNCSVNMEDPDDDGIYEVEIEQAGIGAADYPYKFNINCDQARWEGDPNRFYTVTGNEPDDDGDGLIDVVVETRFFDDINSAETACDVELLFQVDMNLWIDLDRFDPAVDTVVVRGGFNQWGCSEIMDDTDGDGIYTLEIEESSVLPGDYEYKYNINCAESGWEGDPNRVYTVTCAEPDDDGDGLKEVVIGPVFYDRISPEIDLFDVEVLFSVDMNVQMEMGTFDPTFDSPVVRAGFNGWGCSVDMEDPDDDGIYELEIQLTNVTAGDHPYKFNIACSGAWEDSIANRLFTVTGFEPDEDGDGFLEVVLETVFFDDVDASALTCDMEVLFLVDMSVQIASGQFDPALDEVVVRGDFNAWQCSPAMADTNGDNIFELEIPQTVVTPGDYEFKFNINCSEDLWETRDNRVYSITCEEEDNDGDGLNELTVPVVFYDDSAAPVAGFKRGDSNANGTLDIGDPIINLGHQFLGDQVVCRDALDFNDSGTIDISDPVANLSHQFLGLAPPEAPGKEACGADPTDDDGIDCVDYPQENC